MKFAVDAHRCSAFGTLKLVTVKTLDIDSFNLQDVGLIRRR